MPVPLQRKTPSQIEIDAAESEISKIAAYLQEHLGQRMAAYISGLQDPKMVGQWAKGRVQPRDAASLRLRNGYQATRLIAEAFGDETAKAWFFGSSRQLGGEAPAFVLRCADQPEDATPVVLAASGFVESSHGEKKRELAFADIKVGTADVSRQEAHQLARFLIGRISLNEKDPTPEVEDEVGGETKEKLLRLLRRPAPQADRVLDLAVQEIAERLEEEIERLKNDPAERSERAGL